MGPRTGRRVGSWKSIKLVLIMFLLGMILGCRGDGNGDVGNSIGSAAPSVSMHATESTSAVIGRGIAAGHLNQLDASDNAPVVSAVPSNAGLGFDEPPTMTPYQAPSEIVSIVCSYTDWDCSEMLSIIQRESNFDPSAYNSIGIGVQGLDHAQGLCGLALPLHQRFVHGDFNDPVVQVEACHELWAEQGEVPWRI